MAASAKGVVAVIEKLLHKRPWAILLLLLFLSSSGSFMLAKYLIEREASTAVNLEAEQKYEVDQAIDVEADYDYTSENIEFITNFWETAGYLIFQEDSGFLVIPTSYELDFRRTFAEFLLTIADLGYGITFDIDSQQPKASLSVALADSHLAKGQAQANKVVYRQLTPAEPWDYFANDQLTNNEHPKLAIIIDDWGYSSRAVNPILDFPLPLTTAILPYLPISKEVAERSFNIGHEVILHQPMEAVSGLDIGEGGVTTTMEHQEIIEQIQRNIMHLPMVVGVNNHMGSKATSDPATMKSVLEALRQLDLFFVDSLTTPLTVTEELAKELTVPYAVNMLFLDNVNEVEEIKSQIRKGLELAQQSGEAIAIGHVRPTTATALWEMIPEIIKSGVELVPVSRLLTFSEPATYAYESYEEEGAY